MARAILVVWVLFGCVAGDIVFPRCIKDETLAKPTTNLRYLQYSDGTLHNVSIPSAGWASARISGEITRILISEVMGFATTLEDTQSDLSNKVINWIVGCSDPSDPTCKLRDTTRPRFHFSIESWMGAQQRVAALPEELRPTQIKTLGFSLDDTFFLRGDVVQAGLNATGCGLDWYRCYNARWYKPHEFFDTWEHMVELLGVENLQPCSTDSWCQPPLSTTYVAVTGDTESMGFVDGNYNIVCENDYIWFSPACRHNRSLCVPMMVQYSRQNYMQLAVFHNMPMAIVQIRSSGTARYYSAATKGRFLFGWYTPDDAMIDAQGSMPVILNFPRNNALEYQRNVFRTGLASFYAINYCWPELPSVGNGADVMYFLKGFNLYDQDTDALMIRSRILKDRGLDELAVARTAACEWVTANADRWRLWIPVVCEAGLYADPSRRCVACPTGHYCSGRDPPADCPPGHYCPAGAAAPTRCPVGTEQPDALAASPAACRPCRPGYTKAEAALVSCVPCPAGYHCPPNATAPRLCEPGTYSDELGLLQCRPCAPGTFAKSNGMSACAPCPAGQRQDLPGRAECVYCAAGTYADGEGATACRACPFANAATASAGSQTVMECGCKEGYYHPCLVPVPAAARAGGDGLDAVVGLDNSSCYVTAAAGAYSALNASALTAYCRPCPDEGMTCPGGLDPRGGGAGSVFHAQPRAVAGYALTYSMPYGAFACEDDDGEVCPGGPAGVCGRGRDGGVPACGVCVEGSFQLERKCVPCATHFEWFDVLVAVLAVLLWILLFYRGADWASMADRGNADLTCAAAVVVRALSVVYIITSNSKPTAGTPLGSLGTFLESVLSQFSVIRPVCTMGRSFAARYLSKIGLYLALVALAWIAQNGRALLCIDRKGLSSARMINFLGMLVSGFYILIAKSVVLIYECRLNPNGHETMVNFPDVLCTDPDRRAMLPVAYALTIVVVVGTPLWFGWAVYHAPRRLDKDEAFTEATMFLFQHYKRERYFSAILLLFRSLLLSLTGVLFPGSIIMQTAFFVCILSLSIVNTLMLLPYQSTTNNLLDSTLCLLVMWLALANGADIALTSGQYLGHAPISTLGRLSSFAVYAIFIAAAIGLAREAFIVVARIRESPPTDDEHQLVRLVRRLSLHVRKLPPPAANYRKPAAAGDDDAKGDPEQAIDIDVLPAAAAAVHHDAPPPARAPATAWGEAPPAGGGRPAREHETATLAAARAPGAAAQPAAAADAARARPPWAATARVEPAAATPADGGLPPVRPRRALRPLPIVALGGGGGGGGPGSNVGVDGGDR